MKFIKLTILPALFLAFAVMFNGCMDSVNTVENTEKSMTPNFVRSKRVVTDGYLDKRLKVIRVDTEQLKSDLLQVQVTLKSTRTGLWDWLWHGDNPYIITYRFTWLNSGGMAVDTASSVWLQKDVLPGETLWISAVAPNSKCKDFVLKIRELE